MAYGPKPKTWDQIFSKFAKDQTAAGCIVWSGQKNQQGYGLMERRPKGERVIILAHRFAWQADNGNIPPEIHVLHRCDNPSCVNIDHLFTGTHHDNMDDMAVKGRANKLESGRITNVERAERLSDLLAGMSNAEMMRKYGIGLQAVLQWKRRWKKRLGMNDNNRCTKSC